MPRKTSIVAVFVALTGGLAVADDGAIAEGLAAAKGDYEKACEKARTGLVAELRKKADAAQKAGDLKSLERFEAEIEAFDKRGVLPKSIPTKLFQGEILRARTKLEDAYAAAVKGYTKDGMRAEAKAAQQELDDFKKGASVSGPPAEPLFNGTDLTGWRANTNAKLWAVEGGRLVSKGDGAGWLLTTKEYADFELRCEYRWGSKGGNSGIAIRTAPDTDPVVSGLEIQLIDDEGYPGKLADYQHTGSIYNVQPAKPAANKKPGEWNSIRVVNRGQRVIVEQNGKELVNANLDDHKAKFDKHPGLKREKGQIGLQGQSGRIEFRNIVIKELK